MTAIFMDGFDHYGLDSSSLSSSQKQSPRQLADGPYSYVQSVYCGIPSWGAPATGVGCLIWSGSSPQGCRFSLPTPGTNFYGSFRWATDTLYSGGPAILAVMDNSANIICTLSFLANGSLVLKDISNNVLGSTSGPVVVTQNWHLMEFNVNTTAHTFQLRLDDAQATNSLTMSVTNAAITGTIGIISVIEGNTSGVPMYVDDFFIRDAAGTVNNGWLGDRRISTLLANADTAISGWTPNYYKEFGAGILQLSSLLASNSTVQNPTAFVSAPASTGLDIGAGDFTLETFVRFDSLPTAGSYSSIFSRWDTGANNRSYRLILGSQGFNNSSLQFDTSTDGTTSTVATKVLYPWTPNTNQWYHLALVRASGQLLLFVNGQQLGVPVTDSATYFGGGSERLAVGIEYRESSGVVANTNLIGRLDETRFTNGYARYTTTFTTPSAAFPRGSGSDAQWSQVVLLMGYDSGIIDESGFSRVITAANGSVAFQPTDGAAVGVYSTVNKLTPDDNTYIQASLLNATNTLTMITQPTNGNTVTVGTKNGSTAAVYTFKTTVTTAFDVLIDTTAQNTLLNLMNAINAGAGSGTKYGTGTTSNFDVVASQLPAGQILVTANVAGTAGNSIASTRTGTAASWLTATLTGGANIPGPTAFKLQRPPNNTTLISAMQMNVRALKTDSGTASIQQTFVGSLGGTAAGTVKNLTVSATYYRDIIETDPDTSSSLTPTTIINGTVSINRTA
jgi:hypothetical protein